MSYGAPAPCNHPCADAFSLVKSATTEPVGWGEKQNLILIWLFLFIFHSKDLQKMVRIFLAYLSCLILPT